MEIHTHTHTHTLTHRQRADATGTNNSLSQSLLIDLSCLQYVNNMHVGGGEGLVRVLENHKGVVPQILLLLLCYFL